MQLFNLAPTDWRIYESTGMNDKNPNWKSMINMETLILTKDIERIAHWGNESEQLDSLRNLALVFNIEKLSLV